MSLFRRDERGQAVLEFALLLPPLILILVFGMVELGTAFSHNMSIASSTREGARMGSNLANGGGALGCGSGQSPNAASVDPRIIAAVEKLLTGTGALVSLADVTEIRIFKATATGAETTGLVNRWVYTPGSGPVIDGDALDFSLSGSVGWAACSRNNVAPADSVGITVRYTYRARTPLRFFMPFLSTIAMSDKTVMTLNATR
ncbi:MAG: TadE/TadG family type IV pilus assembly protein [Candidatus Limnocylindria bacterium]